MYSMNETDKCFEALETIDRVQELVVVINRHGLEDSIKDLFGHDLAELSPAYAAGKDSTIIIEELNIAAEGLVEKVIEIIKAFWKAICDFFKSMYIKLMDKVTRVLEKIKRLMGLTVTETVEVKREYNEAALKNVVPLTKDKVNAFINVATPGIVDTVLKELSDKNITPIAIVEKHKRLFDTIGLKYNTATRKVEPPVVTETTKYLTDAGFGNNIVEDIEWACQHKQWLELSKKPTDINDLAAKAIKQMEVAYIGRFKAFNDLTPSGNGPNPYLVNKLSPEMELKMMMIKSFVFLYFTMYDQVCVTHERLLAAIDLVITSTKA